MSSTNTHENKLPSNHKTNKNRKSLTSNQAKHQIDYPSPGIPENFSDQVISSDNPKLILAMVGLPARGKTYVARKIRRHLSWLGFSTKLFNVGNYRRLIEGSKKPANFFDPENKDGVLARKKCAMTALNDLMNFLKHENGTVGIYDGTNSTKERRELVRNEIKRMAGDMKYRIVWVECICNNKEIIKKSIQEYKLRSPDYIDVDSEKAFKDFEKRISFYKKGYVPLDDMEESYIKLMNMKSRIISNNIEGYLPGKILFFLVNLKINKKPVFITRHGESEYNRVSRIGGDSPLSKNGRQYAQEIYNFIRQQPEFKQDLIVWCSTLKRTIETANHLSQDKSRKPPIQWRALSEIESGVCDGMSYSEIEEKMPDQFKARAEDKLNYRYPRGESYRDVIMRLEPVILELERTTQPVLIIGHRAVLRCLYAYFRDIEPEKIPHLSMPLHTVFKLEQVAYGCEETRYEFGIDSVDAIEQNSRISISKKANTVVTISRKCSPCVFVPVSLVDPCEKK